MFSSLEEKVDISKAIEIATRISPILLTAGEEYRELDCGVDVKTEIVRRVSPPYLRTRLSIEGPTDYGEEFIIDADGSKVHMPNPIYMKEKYTPGKVPKSEIGYIVAIDRALKALIDMGFRQQDANDYSIDLVRQS